MEWKPINKTEIIGLKSPWNIENLQSDFFGCIKINLSWKENKPTFGMFLWLFCLFKSHKLYLVIIISILNNHTAYFAVFFYLQQFEGFILCLLCSSLSLSIRLQKQLCRSTIIHWNQFKRRNEKRHKNFR